MTMAALLRPFASWWIGGVPIGLAKALSIWAGVSAGASCIAIVCTSHVAGNSSVKSMSPYQAREGMVTRWRSVVVGSGGACIIFHSFEMHSFHAVERSVEH